MSFPDTANVRRQLWASIMGAGSDPWGQIPVPPQVIGLSWSSHGPLRYLTGICRCQVHHRTPGSAGQQLEPGHRPPATPPPAPPRREARHHLKPPAAFRIPASRVQLRHFRPAPISDLHTDEPVPGTPPYTRTPQHRARRLAFLESSAMHSPHRSGISVATSRKAGPTVYASPDTARSAHAGSAIDDRRRDPIQHSNSI